MVKEAQARIKINKKLEESGFIGSEDSIATGNQNSIIGLVNDSYRHKYHHGF